MDSIPQTTTDLFYAFGAFFLIFLGYLLMLRTDQKKIWSELEQRFAHDSDKK